TLWSARTPAASRIVPSPPARTTSDEPLRSAAAAAARTAGGVLRRTTEALTARGHRDVAVVEASTPPAVRAAAAAALRNGSSLVVLAGGDGTIRDAAGVLADHRVTVGIVPSGTGNLYAVSVGVPRETDAAIAALRTGTPRSFDIGEVLLAPPAGQAAAPARAARAAEADAAAVAAIQPAAVPTQFMVACGTGLDARLIEGTSADMKRRYGVAAYFFAAAGLLPHLRANPTILTIDGVRTELESVVVLVANCGEAIPGRVRPRLPLDPADGLLHVFVLPRGGVVHGIRGVLELMTTQATGTSSSGSAIRLAGSHVSVEVMPSQPVQVDGDPFPASSIDARIRPGVLSVIVP
ncbi:MAG: diacylglycerol/lipid kinase family protein, partial [Candidatus Limnocylindrales bacterium]